MSDLCDFLQARLDEDEQVARRACEYANAEWHLDEEFGETVLWWPPEPHVAEAERRHGLRVTSDQWRGQTIASNGDHIAPHIARHDPARVLREVKAKLLIVDAYEAQIAERQRLGVLRDAELAKGDELAPEVARLTGSGIGVNSWINHLGWVVRVMATTYDTHPDYREEWRP